MLFGDLQRVAVGSPKADKEEWLGVQAGKATGATEVPESNQHLPAS